MGETRKLAAILVADIVGFSRLAGSDEQRTLARIRALRGDLVDPAVAAHHGRIVKGTGDGFIIEFRSVVDAARCAIEIQNGVIERNAGVPAERRIEFRIGIHAGEVVEESDGDLMGDAVNIAARLEGIAKPGAICLSDDAYRQVKGRLEMEVSDLGATQLKNIAEPVRAYLVEVRSRTRRASSVGASPPARRRSRHACDPGCRRRRGLGLFRRQALDDRGHVHDAALNGPERRHSADRFFVLTGCFVGAGRRCHASHGQPADAAVASPAPTSGEARIGQPARRPASGKKGSALLNEGPDIRLGGGAIGRCRRRIGFFATLLPLGGADQR